MSETTVSAKIWAIGNIEIRGDDGGGSEVTGVLLEMPPEEVRKVGQAGLLFKSLSVTLMHGDAWSEVLRATEALGRAIASSDATETHKDEAARLLVAIRRMGPARDKPLPTPDT